MKKYIILITLFLGFQSFSNASDDGGEYHVVFLIESFDGKEVQEIHYPIGTTFHVNQLRSTENTLKTNRKAVYSGDVNLTIYPSYSSEESKMSIENKRLTVFYYTQSQDEIVVETKLSENAVVPNTEEELGFLLYPNPAKAFVNIDIDGPSTAYIELINSSGKVLRTVDSNQRGTTIRLNTEDLDTGVYFVRAKFEDRRSITERVLVE